MGTREDREIRARGQSRGEATSEEIRAEIDHTLSRMDHTLDELGNRLRPGHLIDDIVGYIRGRAASTFEQELSEPKVPEPVPEPKGEPTTPGDRPVNWRRAIGPAALVLAGMSWMIFEEERTRRRRTGRLQREAVPPTEFNEERASAWRRIAGKIKW